MATAWYKSGVAPKLLRSFQGNKSGGRHRTIEVWNTTCIVTNFGKTTEAGCSALINPANPQLSGVSKFPYFPKGGPVPKQYPQKNSHHIMGYVSQWGGMEVGGGMLFPANVVDGLVHQLGGKQLALLCWWQPTVQGRDVKCPIGKALVTGPGIGSDLSQQYDHIVHTVPPFYDHPGDVGDHDAAFANNDSDDPEKSLEESYHSSLMLAFSDGNAVDRRVACPLLGAGGRGFPVHVAVEIAGKAAVEWQRNNPEETNGILAFGIPDPSIAEDLIDAIAAAIDVKESAGEAASSVLPRDRKTMVRKQ